MQRRPLRKGRHDQLLCDLSLGDGMERHDRPVNSIALTAWLVPRPGGADGDDYDDNDIEVSNLEEAAKAPGHLNRRRSSVATPAKPKTSCAVM